MTDNSDRAGDPDKFAALNRLLEAAFADADKIVQGQASIDLTDILGTALAADVSALGDVKHSARGVALTLSAFKAIEPTQDIRSHKADHPAGFSARAYDTRVTVPFLISKMLPRSVESHWLSQTFSFAGPYLPESVLKTQPTAAGPLLIKVVTAVNASEGKIAYAVVVGLIERLIRIRNAGRVVLTRPKDLPIHVVRRLIEQHLSRPYRSNAPRLPQLVIYAVYMCLVATMTRYAGATLEPLERLKSADRKRGTIGDVVVAHDGRRIEAVEIKHDQPIQYNHVAEAIDKVRSETVKRYYLLSSKGIDPADSGRIFARREEFLKQNGCELIINGIFESLSYYLRLLPNTTDFLFAYADLLENDDDTGYEHRIAWNECCEMI